MSETMLEGQRHLPIGVLMGQTLIMYLSIKGKIKWLNATS